MYCCIVPYTALVHQYTKIPHTALARQYTKNKISYMSCLPKYDIFSHFLHIYLVEDKAEFWKMSEMHQKCPILQISYMYEIQIFI